jgi:hypothetical protein
MVSSNKGTNMTEREFRLLQNAASSMENVVDYLYASGKPLEAADNLLAELTEAVDVAWEARGWAVEDMEQREHDAALDRQRARCY